MNNFNHWSVFCAWIRWKQHLRTEIELENSIIHAYIERTKRIDLPL